MISPVSLSPIFFCIALFACSSPTVLSNNTQAISPVVTSNHLMEQNTLPINSHIANAELQLLSLEKYSTKRCLLGQLAIAEKLLNKAVQEHDAKMEKDAFISLLAFDRQVRKTHCISQYIAGGLGCGDTTNKTLLKHWYRQGEYNQCQSLPLANKVTDRKHSLITETLHDFDQAGIKAIYYPSLHTQLSLLKSFPNSTLHIVGHTDSKGSKRYNDKLSAQRAQQVAQFFIDNGIAPAQIVLAFKGEASLRTLEKDDVSRVFNRFTTITLQLDINNQ